MTEQFTFSKTIDVPLEIAYRIVAEVEKYPEFLPHIIETRIANRKGNIEEVIITARIGLFHESSRSLAHFEKNRSIHIQQIQGPFKSMELRWNFEQTDGGTQVTLNGSAEMNGFWSAKFLFGLFRKETRHIMRAFVRRAEILAYYQQPQKSNRLLQNRQFTS
ncbi:SRPBCC family protein [bacterium]|nr:SRPBCC family protein [bacterium]